MNKFYYCSRFSTTLECRANTILEKSFQELKSLLIDREYKEKTINIALDKARNIPRIFALQKA